jgi:7,8-dihydropterin-6-yl-methyl-4-(beta-D-ribofuranosyl)aminobenzene 5'-phosphate synthase
VRELPELTLAIKRPNGLMLVDGCSHAGIEAILEAASAVDPRTEIVFGGLHLVTTQVEEIDALVENLKTKWKVQRIAPGHCTGEPALADDFRTLVLCHSLDPQVIEIVVAEL